MSTHEPDPTPAALEQRLCALEDIPDGDTRGFFPSEHHEDRLFAVRRGGTVHVYLNSCPHTWGPLDWARHKFLAARGGDIVCFGHGARFDVASGVCTAGVCLGQRLISVPARVGDGVVYVPAVLPASPR
jgi:nitrite reductase/ring-hydroxylating ferredoxin subunit